MGRPKAKGFSRAAVKFIHSLLGYRIGDGSKIALFCKILLSNFINVLV